jgi:hypothetical protein
MMTQTKGVGRFCNQLFRNIAVSLIAEKCNLMVEYVSIDLIRLLGISLYTDGTKVYAETVALSDSNYIEMYNNAQNVTNNLNPNNDFFQTKEISQLIHTYIKTQKDNVIYANPFKDRYLMNHDVCVHVRLTDSAQHNPGASYYIQTLARIKSDNIIIATDEPKHSIIHEIAKSYPNCKILNLDMIKTIQFASTCKNVILSHGSFSAIIGYLSYYSTIYYPKYDKNHMWYGDMFSIDGWIQV